MRQYVVTALKCIAGLGLLGFIIYKVDLDLVLDAARQAKPLHLALALILLPVNIAIETAIWQSVTVQLGIRVGWRQLWDAVMAGFSLGAVTPARIGEFAGRAYYLPKEDRWKGVIGWRECIGVGPRIACR